MLSNLISFVNRLLMERFKSILVGSLALVMVIMSGVWLGPTIAQQVTGTLGSPSATTTHQRRATPAAGTAVWWRDQG